MAQLVEHCICIAEVAGSIPARSTGSLKSEENKSIFIAISAKGLFKLKQSVDA